MVSGVEPLRQNGTTVRSTRLGNMAFCPATSIDGTNHPLYGESIDTMIQVADIGAIEVIRRCHGAPDLGRLGKRVRHHRDLDASGRAEGQ